MIRQISVYRLVLLVSLPLGVMLGLALAFLWIRSHPPAAPGFPVTRIDCPCATDHDNVSILLRAYEVHDSAAVAGLVSRNHAILLTAGTKVYVDEPLENLIRPGSATPVVQIQSGAHAGEDCYLSREFIK